MTHGTLGAPGRRAHSHRQLKELRFRETLGKTVRAVIEERRLDAAKAMLQETDRRLSLVADLCGFPSLEHLSHLFTARFGQSMTEYRAAQRAGSDKNAK